MALDYTLLDCHASRMLLAIESVLEGKANTDAQSLTHDGKSITRYSFEDLRRLRTSYQAEYERDLISAGLKARRPRKLLTRFV